MAPEVPTAEVERRIRARGELLCLTVSGSTAYGLANEDSDIDLQGVYRAPTAQVLQIWGGPKETFHKANTPCPRCGGEGLDVPRIEAGDPHPVGNCPDCAGTGFMPDYTVHELGKFLKLAASGNPTVLEVLFLEPVVTSPAWEIILHHRDAFISTAVRRTYGGYAKQQLEKKKRRENEGLEGYGPKTKLRGAKHTRHLVRLMLQEEQLLSTGVITPRLSDEQVAFVRSVENWDAAQTEEYFNEMTLKLTGVNCNIPPEPDYERINELLLELRGF